MIKNEYKRNDYCMVGVLVAIGVLVSCFSVDMLKINKKDLSARILFNAGLIPMFIAFFASMYIVGQSMKALGIMKVIQGVIYVDFIATNVILYLNILTLFLSLIGFWIILLYARRANLQAK